MRALFCAAIFVVCLVPARSETRTPASPVTVVYRFDGPTPELVNAAGNQRRGAGIGMEPSSVRPNWRDRAGLASSESFENLVVVDFHGRCRMGPGDSAAREDQPLGRTQVVDGQVLPFVEIECGRVQSFLRTSLLSGRDPDVVLGRALARVLAHELYHVLADTTAHSRSGIAKPALSGTDLSSLRFDFAPSDVDRMKSPSEQPLAEHVPGGALGFVP